MRRTCRSVAKGERGQVLFLFVGIVTVFLLMAAVVVDLSLWLAERRDVQKVADLAAAAGALDLPVDDSTAVDAACEIAMRNGFADCGESETNDVFVELLCNSGQSAIPGICSDPAGAGTSECSIGDGCDTIRVTVTSSGPILFSSVFGITDSTVASGAAAGLRWGETAVDGVLLLDATGSMGSGANGCDAEQDNPGCPMKEARDAATGFVDFLLGQGGQMRVGYAAYNYCYSPDFTPVPPPAPTPQTNQCVPRLSPQNVIDPTSNAPQIKSTIANTLGHGGTNLCVPLIEAGRMLPGSVTGVTRAVVVMSDGDNNFSYGPGPATYPPLNCRASVQGGVSNCPNGAQATGEREIDANTYQLARTLKARGIQIYVLGFGVCTGPGGQVPWSPGDCVHIGNADTDRIADQRLLKCIASSPSHYFRVEDASDLPNVFRQVAAAILGRRLLQ